MVTIGTQQARPPYSSKSGVSRPEPTPAQAALASAISLGPGMVDVEVTAGRVVVTGVGVTAGRVVVLTHDAGQADR